MSSVTSKTSKLTSKRAETLTDDALLAILSGDSAFIESVILEIPAISAEPGFSLMSAEWIQRYWKTIVGTLKPALTDDKILKWSMETSAAGLSVMISQHFGLPEPSTPAAIALAVLILRAAKKQIIKRKSASTSSTTKPTGKTEPRSKSRQRPGSRPK